MLLALGAVAAGAGRSGAAFSATTSNGAAPVASIADWTAPTTSAAVIASASAGSGVKAGGSYNVYANVSDAGNPASGVSSVKADASNVTTGQTAVTLSACAASCTVAGVTYGYKSAALTANAALTAGSKSFTVTATDVAGNASGATGFTVTADNTAPTVTAAVVAHASAGPGVKAGGTYAVYANATDASSAVAAVAANVNNITTGQTAVSLPACSSSCTVAGVTYAFKSATLTSNAGLSAGTKSFTVTATDAPGNASSATSFNATADTTAPTAVDVQTTNAGTNGRAESGDTIALTFSEQMDPDSILSGWSGASTSAAIRISNAGAGNNDVVTFWNLANTTQTTALGSVNLGRAGYVPTGTTAVFAATMVQSSAIVTITLGSLSSGSVTTAGSTGTMAWSSSTTPTDLAGNSASGNARSETGTADKEF